ncbi:hypothetical protein [Granulicella aggregans]|uniref:hypothetical protein n=1 Tax=Granulicella aggregans TaxID=474949 RepID=UPI001C85F215|nr:hypothetical protein [Granulicella aggregans]
MILKQAGFDICTVTDPHKLTDRLESGSGSHDLLILCHTVPIEERESIASLAAQNRTLVLQIEALISPSKLVQEVARVVDCPLTL